MAFLDYIYTVDFIKQMSHGIAYTMNKITKYYMLFKKNHFPLWYVKLSLLPTSSDCMLGKDIIEKGFGRISS